MRRGALLGLALWAVASPSWAADPAAVAPGIFRRKVVASDGAPLALFRYVPPGGGAAHPPVLLIPELGLGREAYDLGGEGLARYLMERGREVFVAELRGQGRSAAPKGWRLRELVERDLPALVAAVQALRPGPMDVVAHGYSGTLLLAASTRELQGALGKVVALCTPVHPEVPSPVAALFLGQGGRFSSLGSDPEGARIFQLLFAHGGVFKPTTLSELRAVGTSDLGPTAAAELLGWMEKGDLAFSDGSTVLSRLARYDRPTFLVLPLRDNFAHPEYASPLREISKARVQMKVLTRLELMTEDYSHLSMLLGSGAPKDLFAPALAFLEAPIPAKEPTP